MKKGSVRRVKGYSGRVVFKFRDSVQVPYEDVVHVHIQKRGIGPWNQLAKNFPGIALNRYFRDPDQILALAERAKTLDPTCRPPNLLTYFVVYVPEGINRDAVAAALREWPSVEAVYDDSRGEDAGTNPYYQPYGGQPGQGYLWAAPGGIGAGPTPGGISAAYAWKVAGGDGAGQSVVAIERNVDVTHEDLAERDISLPSPVPTTNPIDKQHGTAMAGILAMVDNNLGGLGTAPAVANVAVCIHDEYLGGPNPPMETVAQAIADATTWLNDQNGGAGGVISISQQWSLLDQSGQAWIVPVEGGDPNYQAINMAFLNGHVVVEAAGNGAQDLDNYVAPSGVAVLGVHIDQYGNKIPNRDSGAIIVGAATSQFSPSQTPHTIEPTKTTPSGTFLGSNVGQRIDCYAWGDHVVTCDISKIPPYGRTAGTSAAAAIISGAALCLQGMAQANLGQPLSPSAVRSLLSDQALGTKSANGAADKIGVMPDLEKIAAVILRQLEQDEM